jgi:NitT/TauT family transport system ATP-binding protein
MSFPPTTHSVLPLVALRGVGKSFASGTHALAGLDLEIRPGEFLSLLGPSGCGKSTALRIIAGLSAPSQGVIEWPAAAGKSGKSQCAKSGLGFVFQEPTLMPWTSVFDNVKLPLDRRAACACVCPSPARW